MKKINRIIEGKTTMLKINSRLIETETKVKKLHHGFHGIKYKTNFNLAEFGKWKN